MLERIEDRAELLKYLHTAMQLEHSTIPPYLTALYSIHDGTNAEAASALRLVVVEEMLHLTLVANIINSLGGTIDLTDEDFVPEYPTHLPDGETDFEVEILRLCPEAIETFLRIERPGDKGADREHVDRHRSPRALVPHFRHHAGHDLHFFSIGEFYAEIERGLTTLEQSEAATGGTLFTGDPARQVRPGDYFQDTGPLGTVTDLPSALLAIDFITEQGEGLGDRIYGEFGELGHYYRLEQLLLGVAYQPGDGHGEPTGRRLDVDWSAVHRMRPNARWSDYPEGSAARALAEEFDDEYSAFLRLLTDAYTGQPKLLDQAFPVMFRLRDIYARMVQEPLPGGEVVAPVFGGSRG